MDAKTSLKSKLPSRHVTEGPIGRPSLVLLRHGPDARADPSAFVGVASCWNEAAPCNISLMRQPRRPKKGVGGPRAARRGNLHHHGHAICIAMGHEGTRSPLCRSR